MRVLCQEEIDTIKSVNGTGFIGRRLAVVVELALLALTEQEILDLNTKDVKTETSGLVINVGDNRVVGPDSAAAATQYYLFLRNHLTEYDDIDGPFIISTATDRLTVRSLRKTLAESSKKSGIKFNFHDLRATAVWRAWDQTRCLIKTANICRIATSSTLIRHLVLVDARAIE